MGEYATLKLSRKCVKIGTCSSMYYLREEKRNNVEYDSDFEGSRFRIPFFDEDSVTTGHYEIFNRGLSLSGYSCKEFAENTGTQQTTSKSGILINLKCYHNELLPKVSGDAKLFFNGKSSLNYELRSLKLIDEEKNIFKPVVECVWCGEAWCVDWEDIWDFIPEEYQKRFLKYTNFKKEIVIEGKTIRISQESYNALKKSLLK